MTKQEEKFKTILLSYKQDCDIKQQSYNTATYNMT